MISKELFHKKMVEIGEMGNIDEAKLKDNIIDGYQKLFDLLKTMLSQLSIAHHLPEHQNIIALERGIYPDDGEPLFFDYFGSTHNEFCQSHNLDPNHVKHLYKIIFSGGDQIEFATKKFDTDRNILFLDNLRSQLLPSQQPQLDPIIGKIVEYEYVLSKGSKKKTVISDTSSQIRQVL